MVGWLEREREREFDIDILGQDEGCLIGSVEDEPIETQLRGQQGGD